MTSSVSNEHPRNDGAISLQSQNRELAQKWSYEVWSEKILSGQSVQVTRAKLQKRMEDFLRHATAQEQIELEDSRQQLLDIIQEAKVASERGSPESSERQFREKLKQFCSSASETTYRYSQILDPMVAQAPGYVSLAYAGIKIILMTQMNYQELKDNIPLYLEQIAGKFEIINHLTAYIPTRNLLGKVAQAYSLFTKFLCKAIKYYTQSRTKVYLKAITKPWNRFQELVDAIGQTFVDIKDIAQFHGLIAGHVNLEVGHQTLALMKDQEKKTDDSKAILEDILSQLHAIAIQFTKEKDIRETASLIRQHVDERLEDPMLHKTPIADPIDENIPEDAGLGATMFDQLGGLFADLKVYNQETLRRQVAIQETPEMRNHKSTRRNLLRSEKVLSWIESDTSQLLWVEGNNVLRRSDFNAYFTIPLLVMGESNYESTLILRHFCGTTGMARKPSTLVQALLYQVIERNPSLLERKKDIFAPQESPSVSELWGLLVECLEDVDAECTFIIIDGFDNLEAIESSDIHEETLLTHLDNLVKDRTKFVKVLLTASLAQQLPTLPDEYQALTHFSSPHTGLHHNLSTAAAEDQAQLISHQIIEIQERRCKAVSFQELPFLYPSGTLIYERDGKHWRAYIVAELGGMDPLPFGKLAPLQIRAWAVDHNGKYFTKKYHDLTVSQFNGKQTITSLNFTPAGYLPNETAVHKALVARGRRYWELGSKVSYKQFNGKQGPARVVIDQELRPLVEEPSAQEFTDQFQRTRAGDLKPKVLATCPPTIAVYLLSKLQWSTMDVDRIQELVPDEHRGLNQLFILDDHKHILRSLVPGHSSPKAKHRGEGSLPNENLPVGQVVMTGTTILLHGAPGCGKTFSVECLAETANLPLLRLTHANIGASSQDMAKSLEEWFQLSERWGCIMLLDDVDAFCSQRVSNDMSQNRIVALFTHLIEAHNGLLFLTTNRLGALDDGVRSRIHMKLYYPTFTTEQTRLVLERSLERIKEQLGEDKVQYEIKLDKVVGFMGKTLKDGASNKLNGREIVNICETAVILAQHENTDGIQQDPTDSSMVLKNKHLKKSIQISTGFDEYIKELQQPEYPSGQAYEPWVKFPTQRNRNRKPASISPALSGVSD